MRPMVRCFCSRSGRCPCSSGEFLQQERLNTCSQGLLPSDCGASAHTRFDGRVVPNRVPPTSGHAGDDQDALRLVTQCDGRLSHSDGLPAHAGQLDHLERRDASRLPAKHSNLWRTAAWATVLAMSLISWVPARAADVCGSASSAFVPGMQLKKAVPRTFGGSTAIGAFSDHVRQQSSQRRSGILGVRSMLPRGDSSAFYPRGVEGAAAFWRRGGQRQDSEPRTALSASTITGWQSTAEDDFSGLGVTKYVGECDLPTDKGLFRLRSYLYQGMKIVDRNGEKVQEYVEMEPVVIYKGNLRGSEQAVVRVHDQCFTSEVMGSKRCDCKEQLDLALDYIQDKGGAVIYMPQEGRGIGLAYKVAAYELQDGGLDTVDANRHLGFGDDERSYACIPFVLRDMGIRGIQLVTNNPFKIMQLSELGVNIVGRRPSLVPANKHNENYLRTKAARMAHVIAFDDDDAAAKQSTGPAKPAATKGRFGAASVSAAIEAMAKGTPVVVVGREEGEEGARLCVAGAVASPETVALLMQSGEGTVTAAMSADLHAGLVREGASLRYTESASPAGFSPADRTVTLKQLASPSARAHFFSSPGHVQPERVSSGAVSTAGEAAVAVAELAQMRAVVGTSKLVTEDRLALMSAEAAARFAQERGLVVTSVEDVARFFAHTQ